jgi:hypothetical protein
MATSISITVEKCDESFVAHMVVTGQRNAVVKVMVDDKAKKPLAVDKTGIASLDLGKFGVGNHIVVATIVGASPAVSATETIEVKPKSPMGWFGWIVVFLFWFLVWYKGPGLLTFVYFILTMSVITLIAWLKEALGHEKFLDAFETIIENNNWVFRAIVTMVLVTGFMWYMNPLVPEGMLQSLWHKVTDSSVSVHQHWFWKQINRLFFDHSRTNGWRDSTMFYLRWSIVAIFVSFWDETVKFFKRLHENKKGERKEGLGRFFFWDFVADRVWKLLGIK